MEATIRSERKHAFVLDETGLGKIWNLIENEIGPITAEISFNNAVEVKVTSSNQLLDFENSRKKKIERLELSGRGVNGESAARVVFSRDAYRPIQFSAAGQYDVITSFSDKINEVLDGVKPWYSFVSRVDFFYIIAFVFLVAMLLLNLMVPEKAENSALEFWEGILIIAIGFSIFIGLAFTIWGTNRLRSIFFPTATFAIGQGVERYRVDEKVRWGVFIALGVSFFASTIFPLFG